MFPFCVHRSVLVRPKTKWNLGEKELHFLHEFMLGFRPASRAGCLRVGSPHHRRRRRFNCSDSDAKPRTPGSSAFPQDLEVQGRLIEFSGSLLPISMSNSEVTVITFLRYREGDHATGDALRRRDRFPGDEISRGLKGILFSF